MKKPSPRLPSDRQDANAEASALRRILDRGAASLTDAELLSVLLDSENGCHLESSRLASLLLRDRQGLLGLTGLLSSPREPMLVLKGRQSAVLLASLELGRRMARAEIPPRDPMARPEAVARYLTLRFTQPGQEIMGALFLDSRNRLIRELEIYRGTLSRAAVEPRGVLKEGLLCDAAGFVLFHTHPSGDPSPSAEDLAFTRRLARSGELVGVRLVDHLILGDGASWISLRQRQGW